jgi:hypothetical protein
VGQCSGITPNASRVICVEVRPVREVGSPIEAEQACDELRAHGVKCDYTELAPEPQGFDFLYGATTPGEAKRLYVVVTEEDAERATAILQDWHP